MLKLNLKLSEQISKKYSRQFKIRNCYQNVFNLVNGISELLSENEMEVLYCYAYNGSFYYRHAFCLFCGEIIEPLKSIRENLDVPRIIPFARMRLETYIQLIHTDKKYDLCSSLYTKEIETINGHKDLLKELNPIDISYLLQHITKDSKRFLTLFNDIISGRGIQGF